MYDDSIGDLVEMEKRQLETQLDKSKYAFIVIKANFYNVLIEYLRGFNDTVRNDLDSTQEKSKQVLSSEINEEYLSKALIEMLNNLIKIDNLPVEIEDKSSLLKLRPIGAEEPWRYSFVAKENTIL